MNYSQWNLVVQHPNFDNVTQLYRMVVKFEDGRKLRSFTFKQEDQRYQKGVCCSQKVRAVVRWKTLLELENESKLLAKILISCDVIRSPIAKWMGFPEANYVGYCDFRGLASYSEGQSYRPRVNYIYGGRWVCARYIPVSPTTVYWFICFNSSSSGPK
ncbi:hypothetical protein HN51_011444 [Arachis hypogaea]